jgi:hypothetical protein
MNDTNEMNDVNQTTIKRAFERAEWYLRKTAYNIKIRAETVQYFTRGVNAKRAYRQALRQNPVNWKAAARLILCTIQK